MPRSAPSRTSLHRHRAGAQASETGAHRERFGRWVGRHTSTARSDRSARPQAPASDRMSSLQIPAHHASPSSGSAHLGPLGDSQRAPPWAAPRLELRTRDRWEVRGCGFWYSWCEASLGVPRPRRDATGLGCGSSESATGGLVRAHGEPHVRAAPPGGTRLPKNPLSRGRPIRAERPMLLGHRGDRGPTPAPKDRVVACPLRA